MLDLLNEVAALQANSVDAKGAFPLDPPSDKSWLPFGNTSQKRGVHSDRGRWGDMRFFGVDCILGGNMFLMMCCTC